MLNTEKKKALRTFLGLLMLAGATQAADAGPLRDRIAERRAAQAQEEVEEGAEDATSAALPAGVQVVRDVAYGRDNAQRFDVYLPRNAGNLQNAPVIFMVHGGGWENGDKAMRGVVENKVRHWVPQGYIFISTNYRMLPETAPVEQAEDVARAIAVAQRNAPSWGGDPSKFILIGPSAGSHLIALLAAAPERTQRLGAAPWLGAVLLDSAALDVVQIMENRHARLYDRAFGSDPAYWLRASPYHHLTRNASPMLAVCSTERGASCPQAHNFVNKAQSLGVRAQVSEQALSHREINVQLGTAGSYTNAVDAFIASLGVGQR